MLTRWAIALQNYDFTVRHVPGKLTVVPDMLSRAFTKVNGEPTGIPSEPMLAAICRNGPIDGPYHPPGPREYELSASNVHWVQRHRSEPQGKGTTFRGTKKSLLCVFLGTLSVPFVRG